MIMIFKYEYIYLFNVITYFNEKQFAVVAFKLKNHLVEFVFLNLYVACCIGATFKKNISPAAMAHV